MDKKENTKTKLPINNTMATIGLVGLAGGILGLLMSGVNKMFGENKTELKGVVREMMEGVMEGLISHFETVQLALKSENNKLTKENEDLGEQLDELTKDLADTKAALETLKAKTKKK